MVRFEFRKIFGSWGSKLALLFLAVMVVINCWTGTNAWGTGWVNEQGDEEYGPAAVAKLKAAKKEWTGYLDTEQLTAALRENQRIMATPEAQSNSYELNDIAFGWKQGISDIRDVINHFLSENFNSYNYYLVDSLSADALPGLYENRVRLLKDWLHTDDNYSEAEKQWLIEQYEALETPMYYTYFEGWRQVTNNANWVTMICSMILGYLVAGIFSNEFKWKADSIYYSSVLGRTTNTKAKILAGFLLVTVVYWATMLAYSLYMLCYLGFEGWNCPVQLDRWKCFYNITYLEKYLLVALGGYLGNLFSSFLVMWISSKTKTTLVAVTVPFISIFLPNFLQNYEGSFLGDILGLLPNRLLDITFSINYFDVYSIGSLVVGAIPILFVLYLAATAALIPVMYREFGHKEVT